MSINNEVIIRTQLLMTIFIFQRWISKELLKILKQFAGEKCSLKTYLQLISTSLSAIVNLNL